MALFRNQLHGPALVMLCHVRLCFVASSWGDQVGFGLSYQTLCHNEAFMQLYALLQVQCIAPHSAAQVPYSMTTVDDSCRINTPS